MTKNPSVEEMFNGDVDPDVKFVQDKVMDFMSDKGNHLCSRCGTDLLSVSGCLKCPSCGFSECGE